ncbi:MAG: trypsin-like peptidase domain-containing protein [Deltaproteobacteria bacterium]|nr:trypsin-like peptidase domain-containing protein [Deltaproteobacteria bacterium]
MPKFNNKEEYLKWKQEKSRQGDNNEPVETDNKRYPKKVFYIFILFLLLVILYSLGNKIGNVLKQNPKDVPNQELHPAQELTRYQTKQEPSASTLINQTKPETPPAKLTFPEIVKQAKKAVVTIKTSKGLGSGFLISPSGKIVTNTHVVGKDQTVEVVFISGISERASVVMKGTIPLDIAILEIYGHRSDYDYLQLGDSSDCAEGTDVIAIGSPIGLAGTATKGIISNCNRVSSDVNYIQTDASINSGNSGGPLIDSATGKVIGVNTIKMSGLGLEGLGFAIEINMVKDFMSWKLTSLEEKFRREREEEIKKLASDFELIIIIEFNKYIQAKMRAEFDRIKQLGIKLGKNSREIIEAFNSQAVEHGWNNSERLQKYSLNSLVIESRKYGWDRLRPPSEFDSWEKWFEAMAEGVIDREIPVEKVVEIIKRHFSYA